jgi:formylglycine-generating enzyme required for sulfatase activity
MGDLNGTGAADERPSHQVTLTKGFYLGKYEVTKEQYELVMTGNDLGFSPTPYAGGGTGANTPIVYISYNEVVAFIDRFNQQQSGETQIGWEYILPTEAQWEYTRRAGSTSVWGNFDLSDGPYDLSTGDSYANAQTVLEFNGSLANYNAGAGSPFLHKDVGQYPSQFLGFP